MASRGSTLTSQKLTNLSNLSCKLYASPCLLNSACANSRSSISNRPKISSASFINCFVSGASSALLTVSTPSGVARLQLSVVGAEGEEE